MTNTRVWLGAAAALVISAVPASAQESGWAAWQGCWQPTGEDAPLSQVVCVTPAAEPMSVRVVTLDGGTRAGETLLRADGVARAVDEGGCTGSETATFSADRRRVYTRAELDCDGVRRISTGILALVTEVEWIDVQAVTVGEQHATRIMRYRPAAVPASIAAELGADRGLSVEAARIHAAAPLTVEQVAEASRNVATPVVEALLAARRHGYDLNPRTLVQLRDANVPGSTIDVMVALSYPERFQVQERTNVRDAEDLSPRERSAFMGECYDPYWTTRRYRNSCFDRYGAMYGYDSYRSRSAYSPWGYDPYGWNYRDPIVVVVVPSETDGGGNIVKGRGYTRSTANTSGTARPSASRPADSGSTPRASTSAGASSPTSTSSSGSSSGTDTGRTAKPRGGGGN